LALILNFKHSSVDTSYGSDTLVQLLLPVWLAACCNIT